MSSHISNERPATDKVITDIAEYALEYEIKSDLAYETALFCLIDTLGCGLEALEYPACTKLLGPIVPGTVVPHGARVPGTNYQLDPVQAAFNIGAMIRWLDYNDTWLAAEWGHPSDNLGAILALADYLSRDPARRPWTVRDVLLSMRSRYKVSCRMMGSTWRSVSCGRRSSQRRTKRYGLAGRPDSSAAAQASSVRAMPCLRARPVSPMMRRIASGPSRR